MAVKPERIRNHYVRITGAAHDRSTGVARLYLGPNHLLILRLRSNREVARRFYYADITALRCKPTRWGYVWDGAFIAVAVLFWALHMTSSGEPIATQVLAVTATVIACIALMTNWLRGPTCKTWLHTENHTELLSSLSRYNTARRVLARIHARIIEEQNDLPAEDMDAPPPFAPYAPPAEVAPIAPLRRHDPRWMMWFFCLSCIVVLQALADFVFYSEWTNALGIFTALLLFVLGPAVIVNSYGSNCPSKARVMAVYILAFNCLSIPAMLLLWFLLFMAGIDTSRMGSISSLYPDGRVAFFVIAGFNSLAIIFNATCAVIGLKALRSAADV